MLCKEKKKYVQALAQRLPMCNLWRMLNYKDCNKSMVHQDYLFLYNYVHYIVYV